MKTGATFSLGIVLGVILCLLLGASLQQGRSQFGFAVPEKGSAIIMDSDGALFHIDGNTGIAQAIQQIHTALPIKSRR